MGLVFGAIMILWLTMILLTALTREKKSAADFAETDSTSQTNSYLQAALLAVAIGLAEQEASSAHPLHQPPTAIVSAWQLGTRTRQMTDKENIKRRSHDS